LILYKKKSYKTWKKKFDKQEENDFVGYGYETCVGQAIIIYAGKNVYGFDLELGTSDDCAEITFNCILTKRAITRIFKILSVNNVLIYNNLSKAVRIDYYTESVNITL